MATVVLVGTLDTKGLECGFLSDRLEALGCTVVLVDAGILGEPLAVPDIGRDEVAAAAGTTIAALVAANDRGAAVSAMARGLTRVLADLHTGGRLDGVLGIGGSGGTSLIAEAMRALPIGVPKLIVSTLASGDTSGYVGTVDLTLMYAVVDVAGLNRLSTRILANAAGAIAGMASVYAADRIAPPATGNDRPLIAATMFGVTTPSVTTAREWLEARGYEVLVFHATGSGGRSMEALVAGGFVAGVLDITTTELADELAGGILSAGPDRLRAAGRAGVPQVVSLGALDMANFGPEDTVPERYSDRRFYVHNSATTLMRTTPVESAELGRMVAAALNAATGPTALFIPEGGISAIAGPGQVFHDPAADAALIGAVRDNLADRIEVVSMPDQINDATFAVAMAARLDEMIRAGGNGPA